MTEITWRSAEEFERLRPELGLAPAVATEEPAMPDDLPTDARPLHLVWVTSLSTWVDERCPNDPPCSFHPDDDGGTHGGRMHVHECGEPHDQEAAS